MATEARGYEFLFNDLQQIVTKGHGDFINLVKLRKAEHIQAEESRINAEQQAAAQASQGKPQQDNDALRELSNTLQSTEAYLPAKPESAKNTELSWSLSSWKNRNDISHEAVNELIELLASFGINIFEFKQSA